MNEQDDFISFHCGPLKEPILLSMTEKVNLGDMFGMKKTAKLQISYSGH